MTGRLWLIGGTAESRQLMEILQFSGIQPPIASSLLISVTTDAARTLYPPIARDAIWVGQLTPDQADDFVLAQNVAAILDLSHPFAVQISQLAIALAHTYHLPYLRYERAEVNTSVSNWRDRHNRPGYQTLSNLDEFLVDHWLSGERTLLTLGTRSLPAFKPWQRQGTLFARILPSVAALTTALDAGFTPERLIALRPPVSVAVETALWQQWDISQVVTKSSGHPGGEAQKCAIAARLGIRLICLSRPTITYPHQTDSLDTALSFALRYCT
jgi:precorrin-6A/cobalt-precorrin-6A reductase